jgi:hypothetical protein
MGAVLAGTIGSAHAAMIIRADGFSTGGAPSTVIGFPGFDPEFGTLLSVRVELSGVLSFDVLVLPGETVAPFVQFDAFGIGNGFDFSGSGALFVFGAVSNPPPAEYDPGTPLLMRYATPFNLDFTVTGLTDLAGGIVVPGVSAPGAGMAPPIVHAHRSDFIPDPVPIDISEVLTFMPVGFTPLAGLNAGGAIILTYDYVDLSANPTPAVVSAPPSAGNFVLALMTLWRRRRATTRPNK